jgi:hypothetical protein
MLLRSKDGHARQLAVFFEEFGGCGIGPPIDFGNEEEAAAGLQDAQDPARASRQVGPKIVRFHGGTRSKVLFGNGICETDPWRSATRPEAIQGALVFFATATLTSE